LKYGHCENEVFKWHLKNRKVFWYWAGGKILPQRKIQREIFRWEGLTKLKFLGDLWLDFQWNKNYLFFVRKKFLKFSSRIYYKLRVLLANIHSKLSDVRGSFFNSKKIWKIREVKILTDFNLTQKSNPSTLKKYQVVNLKKKNIDFMSFFQWKISTSQVLFLNEFC
jgi:hypothetical protein